jgi:hypothetical protein
MALTVKMEGLAYSARGRKRPCKAHEDDDISCSLRQTARNPHRFLVVIVKRKYFQIFPCRLNWFTLKLGVIQEYKCTLKNYEKRTGKHRIRTPSYHENGLEFSL